MKQPLNISILAIIFLGLIVLPFHSCKDSNEADQINESEVIKLIQVKMDEQINCWNSGDIPCFMEHYWKSDSLMFIGKSGITLGWQPTLDNYLESYPDQKNMGQLTFDNKLIHFIDKETIQVIGEWHLSRPELDDLGGHYSLIWKKKNDQWVIISDHSS
ncbi:MAG: nuclear transport factor 2 family protein [Flavobacteriales bacterium]|nr:nuclear transport factor 2 family protein [Flavobacteriales bacterium]MCB9196758.1 nuclear transport factor 2 family protein [Flavobacteriales bacterium]